LVFFIGEQQFGRMGFVEGEWQLWSRYHRSVSWEKFSIHNKANLGKRTGLFKLRRKFRSNETILEFGNVVNIIIKLIQFTG
jgi:hypothetical protein